jgi:hypothetical protein
LTEELFLRGAELFWSPIKRPASQITQNESPRMEQVPTMPRLGEDSQEATDVTPPVIIIAIATPAAPLIKVLL